MPQIVANDDGYNDNDFFGLSATINADRTTRYVTPSVKRLLDYAPEELIGRRYIELVHPEDVAKTRPRKTPDTTRAALISTCASGT